LREYTVPFAQLDPLKTILVFSHVQNTFDKKKLLDNPNPTFQPCERTVEEFIKHDYEIHIKNYFMKNIDNELAKYKPGNPSMKPDVIKQTEELRIEREKKQEELKKQQQNQGQIILQSPGQPPKALTTKDVATLLDKQNKELQERGQKLQIQDNLIQQMRNEIESLKAELKLLREQAVP